MMNTKLITARLWSEPPVFFPVLALFHLFLLGRAIVDFWGSPLTTTIALTLLWYALGAGLSISIVLMKRWAAIAYAVLTVIGLVMQFGLTHHSIWVGIGGTLFPVDAVMVLLSLFFYKRFS